MRRSLIALSGFTAVLALSDPAFGQAAPARHSIPWFESRPVEREAALRACRDDERLARLAVCANAEHAANRVGARVRAARAQPRRHGSIEGILSDPDYYAGNRVARAAALAECAAPGNAVPARHCAAARAGAALDPGAVRRGG